jgi:archaeal flagellar protein FlaG
MINRSSAAMVSMTDKIDDRMKTQIDIVHAANSTDCKTIYIWVKNVGSTRIDTIEQSDLFLGPEGDFVRVSHESTAAGNYPRWSYSLENGIDWGTGTTIKITVLYDPEGETPAAGTYFVKIVIPNGIEAEYYFSM